MNQIKKAFLIQSLDSFITGILVIALPLLMLERGIDIVSIGLIYASMPMVFQLTRMAFALISDFIGRKIFFALDGVMSAFSCTLYYFAHSPLEFLFGKITEGVSSASLWSVNRAFVLEQSKDKWKDLVKLRTFDYILAAIGTLIAGFLVVWLFCANALILCTFLSLLIIPPALTIVDKEKRGFRIDKALDHLNLKKKSILFRKTLFLFLILGLSFGLIAGYIFPLFLKENKFSTETIGILLGLQTFFTGISALLFAKSANLRNVILYGGIFYSLILLFLGFSGSIFAALLLLAFSIPNGMIHSGLEGIFSKVTKNRTYGTDIGLLMTALHIGRTISLGLSGILISLSGFSFIFPLSALILSLFFIYAYLLFK